MLGTFVLMYAFDLTLNIMSLGGIALAVGMLVDNAVVVLESIVRKREARHSARRGGALGTREVATAVTAATLTSVAVFFPMVFITGIAGQLFQGPGAHGHVRAAFFAARRPDARADAGRRAANDECGGQAPPRTSRWDALARGVSLRSRRCWAALRAR